VSEGGGIVSLLPAATELVAALGAWDRLLAVSHECDTPAAARGLPRVTASAIDAGGRAGTVDAAVRSAAADGTALFTLDAERIAELKPALILTQGLCEVCAVSEGDVHRLAARLTPSPRVVTLGASTLDDVLASIGVVAAAIGAEAEGMELVAGMRARMRRVHLTLKEARAPRPRVAVLEWTDPIFAAGHWVPDMVRRAGGVDVLATSGSHSRVVTLDDVRAAVPDAIIFSPCGYSLAQGEAEAHEVLAGDDWAWAAGLQLAVMDGNALTSRPGPRLVEGIEVMARLLHPALFSPLAPGRAGRLRPR